MCDWLDLVMIEILQIDERSDDSGENQGREQNPHCRLGLVDAFRPLQAGKHYFAQYIERHDNFLSQSNFLSPNVFDYYRVGVRLPAQSSGTCVD